MTEPSKTPRTDAFGSQMVGPGEPELVDQWAEFARGLERELVERIQSFSEAPDAKDAARYRWLRDRALESDELSDPSPYCVRPEVGTGEQILCGGEELDRLTDGGLEARPL